MRGRTQLFTVHAVTRWHAVDPASRMFQAMYEAWRKAVLMPAILWRQPNVQPEDF